MWNRNYVLSVALLLLVNVAIAQILYPQEDQTDKQKANLAGRLPLYSPQKCGPHELLYPGDQANDWICDCEPTAVYYPEAEACFPVFRRGPCKADQMLVLGKNSILPECISNQGCKDGEIKIRNQCYEFNKNPPCPNPELSFVLGVDPQTLQVDCVMQSIALRNRFDDNLEEVAALFDFNKIGLCPRGCRRSLENKCVVRT